MEQLKETNARVIFETEEFDAEKTDSCLMIPIIKSFEQVENESRSDNIKWTISSVLQMAHQKFTIESVMAYS